MEQSRGAGIESNSDDQGTDSHVDDVATAAFDGEDVERGRVLDDPNGSHRDLVAATAFGDQDAKPGLDEDTEEIAAPDGTPQIR